MVDGLRIDPVVRVCGDIHTPKQEALVVERPLHLVLNKQPLLTTMRTPGHDRCLLLGYLLHEGLLRHIDQLEAYHLEASADSDTVRMSVRGLSQKALLQLRRVGASISSCGVCGREDMNLYPKPTRDLEPVNIEPKQIQAMLAGMRAQQPLFAQTGGLHAAALFSAHDKLLCVYEDIGRHNAVDKASGWMLAQGHQAARPVALVTSGRASFEIMQKAVMAGVGTVISVSAASSLAVDVARRCGVLLMGFVRQDKALIYHDPRT